MIRTLAASIAAGGAAFMTMRVVAAERRSLQPPPPGDALVVFGASVHDWGPSGELRARLDHALDLWRDGRAPVIVVSGGIDRGIDEVVSMTTYLTDAGVPPAAVVPGRPGNNTRATVTTMASLALGRYIAVSSPYHAFRIRSEGRRLHVAVAVSAPAITPETSRPRAHVVRIVVEVLAAVWYLAPPFVTTRIGPGRLRHVIPQMLTGTHLPRRIAP